MKTKIMIFLYRFGIPIFFLIAIIAFAIAAKQAVNETRNTINISDKDMRHWETSPDLCIDDENTYSVCHAGILYYIVRTERDSYALVDALTSSGDIVTCIEEK